MVAENLQYILPYILSLMISVAVGVIAWRRREISGAKTYAALAFSQSTIILGYIFELATPPIEGKIFWDDFQWLGYIFWPVLLPIFALQFTRDGRAKDRRVWALLLIVPAIFLGLLFTNGDHGWVHTDERLISHPPFDILTYEFTPLVNAFAIYGYLVIIAAFGRLLLGYFQSSRLFRSQIGVVVIGAAVPLIGTALALLGASFSYQRDITPLTLAAGNLIVLWGLLRFNLFDIKPIAWDIVVKNMKDCVIVVDNQDRLVSLNDVAREGNLAAQRPVIGKRAGEIFTPWWQEITQLARDESDKLELTTAFNGEPTTLDIQISPVQDQAGIQLGRVLVFRNITRQKEMEKELRSLNCQLEEIVAERTREMEEAYNSTLEGWAKALEIRDKETEGHCRRVTELAIRVATEIDLDEEEILHIRRGALLHDIGKMAIPDEILHKPGPLNEQEWAVMKQHTLVAENLLSHISYLTRAMEIPVYHHEQWDGLGYPHGLRGEDIPISARIFTLVDNWDALLSNRPYRSAWGQKQVMEYILEQQGKKFDPKLTRVFLRVVSGLPFDGWISRQNL
jgi:putative nucleotidyltransferase with HDIG domain